MNDMPTYLLACLFAVPLTGRDQCRDRQSFLCRSISTLVAFIFFLAPFCGCSLSWFWPLCSILGATTTAFCNSVTVQRSTNDVIANTRQISYSPTTNEHN